jgi:hypothetical protein
MRGNAHVRFGGAGRGNGSLERAIPRPGPTLRPAALWRDGQRAALLHLAITQTGVLHQRWGARSRSSGSADM